MNELYGSMSAYITSFRWANRTGAEFEDETGFTKFIALVGGFLWWISYIVASFLFTYTVLGWTFLNFKLDSVLKIVSMVSVVVFLFFIIGSIIYNRRRNGGMTRGLWGKTIFSFVFGTSLTVLFALIMSYVVSLSSSLMLIAVLLSLQIPFSINMVLNLFLSGWVKYGYTGKMSEDEFDRRDKQRIHITDAVVIIVEIIMLGFIIYFGAIPYFKSGGLEAIKDRMSSTFNGTDTIILLFGSKGIIATGATVLSAIVSTIVKIVKKR